MSYEAPREEACPKCGLNFKMPQEYSSSGAKPHPTMRQCSCVPDAYVTVSGTLEEGPLKTAICGLEHRLEEQARFIKLLLSTIPRNVATPESYSPPWIKAIDDSPFDPANLPEEFVKRMTACADAQNSSRPESEGAKYSVCLLCGNSYEMSRTETPVSEIAQINICYSCGVIQKTHPDVFSWVWRIIRWHYYAWAVRVPPVPKETLGRNIITE